MSKQKRTPMAVTVRDSIDLAFDLLTNNPEGYELDMKDFGFYGSYVIKILVDRNVVERKIRGRGKKPLFKWISSQVPNKVFYGSICHQLNDIMKEKIEKRKAKKKSAKKASVDAIAEEPVPAPAVVTVHDGPVPAVPSLDPFSAQELWDELKRRGFFIEGERLCIVKKAYLD